MSDRQYLVEFNFIIDIVCDEITELDPENIDDFTISKSKSDVKSVLWDRVSQMIRHKCNGLGSVHLLDKSFNPSKSSSNSTTTIHSGGSSGKTANVDSLLQIRLGLATYIDLQESENVEDVCTRTWKQIRGFLTKQTIDIDRTNGIVGRLDLGEEGKDSWQNIRGKPKDSNWDADAIEPNMGSGHTSNVPVSDNPQWEKMMASIAAPGLEPTANRDSATTSAGRTRQNPQSLLEDFDPVENAKKAAERYIPNDNQYDSIDEDQYSEEFLEKYNTKYLASGSSNQFTDSGTVGVRKPQGEEISIIADAIYSRIMKVIEKDSEPIYIDEEQVPDEWEKATCANKGCVRDSTTQEISIGYFEEQSKDIIKTRLSEDFGLNQDGYELEDSRTTDLFLTENGKVMIRPETIISWITSIAHHTEPYCEECHNSSHSKKMSKSIKTREVDGDLDTEEPIDEAAQGTDDFELSSMPEIQFESIDIEDELDLDSEQFNSQYRSLTPAEKKRIDKSITFHLKRLATRMSEDNKQSNAIYDIIHKRDYGNSRYREGKYECHECENVISNEKDSLNSFHRHHVRPMAANNIPWCIERMRNLLNRSVGTQAAYAPVKVNTSSGAKGKSRYLFIQDFITTLEEIFRNLDTLTMHCKECKEHRKENQEKIGRNTGSTDDDSDKQYADIKRVVKMSHVTGKPEIEFVCLGCFNEKGSIDDSKHTAEAFNGRYRMEDRFSELTNIPIYTEGVEAKFVPPEGLCPLHRGKWVTQFNCEDIGILKSDKKKVKVRKMFKAIQKWGLP